MDRNALDWLFSTAPQALAALVGLIFAGVAFIGKQSFRAVLCTLIYISIFVPNLNFGQDEHKRRRQVLCLNGSQIPNRVQEQEPSRVL